MKTNPKPSGCSREVDPEFRAKPFEIALHPGRWRLNGTLPPSESAGIYPNLPRDLFLSQRKHHSRSQKLSPETIASFFETGLPNQLCKVQAQRFTGSLHLVAPSRRYRVVAFPIYNRHFVNHDARGQFALLPSLFKPCLPDTLSESVSGIAGCAE